MNVSRIAVIGTGNSVGNHLSAINKLSDRVQLVAVADIDEARVRAVCSEQGISKWYTNVSKMLATEQPDLVHIVTPPATHKRLIIDCLEAGAWVFCEKPLCASLAEFDEISQVEEQTGRFVSTVFQWRFGSAGKHLKSLIQGQALGRPLVGICNTLWYRNQSYYDHSWRGKWSSEFGGPSVTLGIHLVDLFLWLMGDWQEIRAMVGTLARSVEFEDVGMAMVRFETGAMGSIVNSVLSPRQESYLRLDFQDASVEVNAMYRYDNGNWRFTLPDDAVNATVATYWENLKENVPCGHDVQLGEILDAMERNERPPVSGTEARRILEFITSMYKSAFTGQPVLRGEITPSDRFYHATNGVPENIGTE